MDFHNSIMVLHDWIIKFHGWIIKIPNNYQILESNKWFMEFHNSIYDIYDSNHDDPYYDIMMIRFMISMIRIMMIHNSIWVMEHENSNYWAP